MTQDADTLHEYTKTNPTRYLPHHLLEAIHSDLVVDRSNPEVLRLCIAHLETLLRAVVTYLPRYLVREQLADPRSGRVNGQFREATIMFTDISGFTAMSERLAQRGEEGAEKITQIVGDYFTRLIEIAACQEGDLLKFGGDALVVAFWGDGDPTTHDHTLNAVRAAVQMQEAIARFSQVEAFGETFRLKMTVGLGSGALFTANLGTVDKMEYTIMGEALANMARAEDQAEGGEIFIDELTCQMVRPCIQIGEVRNSCYQVLDVQAREHRCVDTPPPIILPQAAGHDLRALTAHIRALLACLDALTPFLPPGLLDLLRFDPAHMAARERGEFRPVTTMFANFYGIEEIIGALGPDHAAEITAILNAHFTTMQEIIQRYDGVIDKVDSYVVGHRIMALFGAPRAHVDDPERAVRAALEMQAAMRAFADLETSAGTFALKQRIGINSGRVFAGNVGSEERHEYSVMGDEVNLTARLMSVAHENQILISQSTANQTGQRFRLEAQAPVKVKGKRLPVANYQVLGLEQAKTEISPRRTPLIGRDAEWQTIWKVAQTVLNGIAQSLALSGEMGMGKSRLIEELLGYWTAHGGRTLLAAGLAYTRHTPYAPWMPLLRDLFGLREEDGETEWAKIGTCIAAVNPNWTVWTPLVAQIAGLNMPESPMLRSLDAKLRQQNVRRVIGELLIAEARHQPLLLVFDDIQWFDASSAALLDHLLTHVLPGTQPMLICTAYRPEETDETPVAHPQTQTIHLEPLDEPGSLALLDSQLPTEPEIPQRLKEVILKNAQGTPLFIVEMAHALIENYMSYDSESGLYRAREDLAHVQVPDTVSRVILSRLDRLDEPSRTMLKVASAIGRIFQEWLLRQVYPHRTEMTELQNNLLSLCEKEILDRASGTGLNADVAYLFRHVMTREVAYESLLYAERRELHRRIAQSIEAQIGERGEYAEPLADHYTLAEVWDKALSYHLRAARRAQAIYANQDAIHRYQQALAAAQHVPDSLADQLAACEGLGDLYELLGQYPEALQHYDQARTILSQMPALPAVQRYRADICRKTGRIYELQGNYETAMEWIRRGLALLGATECLETAQLYLGGAAILQREGKWEQVIRWCKQSLEIVETLDSPEARQTAAHAHYLLGNGHRRLGNTEQALRDYQQSLEIYHALDDQPGTARAYNNLANLTLDQGNWEQATEYYQQALTILERIGDLPSQAILANNLGGVFFNRGRLKNARIYYLQSLKISQELGISFGVALLNNNLGHTAIREGHGKQALTYLQQSLAAFDKIGSQEFLPEVYRHLSEAYLLTGEPEQAHAWAEKSLARALEAGLKLEEGCTRRVLGRIYRQKGAFNLSQQELEASLELLKTLGNPYQVAQTQVELAALYREMGKTEQSADGEALWAHLIALANRVGGHIYPVENNPTVKAKYAAWDAHACSVQAANEVSWAIWQEIVRPTMEIYSPTLQYLVIVGNDLQIPFRRVPDETLIANESTYLNAARVEPNTPLGAALFRGMILTDDMYADRVPFRWKGRWLYVPDLATGRLAETPSEIIAQIDAFLDDPNIAPTQALVTGYDFLTDMAAQVGNSMSAQGLAVTALNNETWNRDDLYQAWVGDRPPTLLAAVNAHYEHWRAQPATNTASTPIFYNTDILNATQAFTGSLNYSLGCHGGLNVPDPSSQPGGWNPDFPQTFGRKAAVWVANTGYGYGMDDAVAGSEKLYLYFQQMLGSEDEIAVGEALRRAKWKFVDTFAPAECDAYLEKSMIQATLYGLPMYMVNLPQTVSATGVGAQGSEVTVKRMGNKVLLEFAPTRHDTPDGTYFSIDGETYAVAGRPIQPKTNITVPVPAGQILHGVRIVQMQTETETDFDPLVYRPITDTALSEPGFGHPSWSPFPFWSINRLGEENRLSVVAGQYMAESEQTGSERKIVSILFEMRMSNSNDASPPLITLAEAVGINGSFTVTVETEDGGSGVQEVWVVYEYRVGQWRSTQLALDTESGLWTGRITSTLPEFDFFIQSIDGAGNVSTGSNKGLYFMATPEKIYLSVVLKSHK